MLKNLRSKWASRSPQKWDEARAFYIAILPWFVGFVIFIAWPMLRSLYLSFTRYNLLSAPKWIGLGNLERLVEDDLFWQALKVTLLYVLGSVPGSTILALIVAMILAQKLRGVSVWRTIYYLPSVVSGVAVAVLWSYVFNPDFGLVNTFLDGLGIKGPGWVTSESWALPAIIIMSWWSIGGQMVIYLAGLKGIPQVLYEVAEIDGAGAWSKFWNVTVPMLSPTIFFNVIMATITSFQVFDAAYVLTRGGPNYATLTYMLYLYRNAFEYSNPNMGYASALAWVLFILILLLTALILRSSSAWVYYESEVED